MGTQCEPSEISETMNLKKLVSLVIVATLEIVVVQNREVIESHGYKKMFQSA